MQIHCKYDELKDPELLTPHPRNSNRHPERQIELLAKIINHTGFRHPVVVSKSSGYIVAGHGRVQAAAMLGEKAPVVMQDFKNEAEEFEFLIADNKISELAEHDDNVMIEGIKELEIEDFELLGMENFDLPIDPDAAKDEMEDDVPTNVDTRCKLGDVWLLGEHRLLCGDATDVLCVDKLMAGAKADMICTDPPYGMNLDTDYSKMGKTTTTYKKVVGDDKPFDAQTIFAAFPECEHYWLWGADYYSDTIPIYDKGNYVVWTKAHSDEENKVWTSRYELVWTFPKCKREVWFIRSIQHHGGERTGEHPTQKPIALTERILKKRSKATNIVDLFGGSGSTLIACEKTNRKCYMMELDPYYCSVVLSRWEKYSSKEAKLET